MKIVYCMGEKFSTISCWAAGQPATFRDIPVCLSRVQYRTLSLSPGGIPVQEEERRVDFIENSARRHRRSGGS